jgi:hypothetical protein
LRALLRDEEEQATYVRELLDIYEWEPKAAFDTIAEIYGR